MASSPWSAANRWIAFIRACKSTADKRRPEVRISATQALICLQTVNKGSAAMAVSSGTAILTQAG